MEQNTVTPVYDPIIPDVLELRNINQSYDNGKTNVIQNLNILVTHHQRGQFISVLGKSGCGKSTTLRYIAGLQNPTSGEVLFHGKSRTKDINVGMVFQKYSSFEWLTVLDNVKMGLKFKNVPDKEATERAMEMIRLVELNGHEKKYARSPTLSGGQLQRVAIARSLISAPKFLLMDEPFGALDVNTRLKMQDLLNDIYMRLSKQDSETTMIFVTHNVDEAVYLSDEIWLMRSNPGQIVERINVALPFERDKSIKRDKNFIDIVYALEDKVSAL